MTTKPQRLSLARQIFGARQKIQRLLDRAAAAAGLGREDAREAVQDLSATLQAMQTTAEAMQEKADLLVEARATVQAEQEQYQALFDLAPDAYVQTNGRGAIERMNQAAEVLLQARAWHIHGKPFVFLVAVPERERFRHWLRTLPPGDERVEWEGTLRGRLGRDFPAAVCVRGASEAGAGRHLFWLIRDLTQYKRLEADLREQATALSELNRRKDEFLAMLGHELRNPLVPLLNAVSILETAGADDATRSWVSGVLRRQVGHLVRLVDDLLDVSRITQGKVKVRSEPLDLAALVRDAAADHRGTLEQAGLTLALDVPEAPVPVLGDGTRLAQVIDNLLHNAAKFTPPGGKVALRLDAGTVHGQAVVTVSDTGNGIAPELLPHLFDPFVQGPGSLSGLGLGLAMVKGLVELHGGNVQAASEGPGRGATFTVCLPLAESVNPPSPPDRAAAPAGPRTVLVIDDNADVAESLAFGLESFGHRVYVTYSGAEGVAAAERLRPHVVLCDLAMSEMDGFAVAAALQASPVRSAFRLIAYSGYGQEEIQHRAAEAGFDLYLTKPVNLAQLQQVLAAPTTCLTA